MAGYVGKAITRVDGRAKVTGAAAYTADTQLPGLCHAVLVTSDRAGGRLTGLETQAAEQAPGVLAVLTYRNARPGGVATLTNALGKFFARAVMPGDAFLVLADDQVRYAGQPIAVVVAETLEKARWAASLVEVRLAGGDVEVELAKHLDEQFSPGKVQDEPADSGRGEVEAALRAAAHKVDVVYTTAAQAHNPMEPHATIAAFDGAKLTLYDATQYVYGVKQVLSAQLGKLPGSVRVISRFVGGAFGSKGLAWPHVPVTAMAAQHVGRPVKLVVERRHMFGFIGFRPETRQHLQLGAAKDGKLVAIAHHGVSQTSRIGEWTEPVGKSTGMLYSCPNVAVTHRLVRLDTQTPTFQRAPGEAPGSLALECALDELAYAAGIDPLELRLTNYASRDEGKDLPFSSKALRACYVQGAERFGWDKRPKSVGQWRVGHRLVGWGMATATYPAMRSGATARVRLQADGSALVQIATHDLGTGTYTILTQMAADALGLPMGRVRTEIGDTDYPYAPVAGGSQSAASCSIPVHEAGHAVRRQLIALAIKDPASPLHGLPADQVDAAEGHLTARGDATRTDTHEAVLARAGRKELEAEHETKPDDVDKRFSCHAWGAQFAEVQVDPDLGMVRVTRMVGAFAGGRVLNLTTARSQLMGGMVMGIGAALLEEVVRDPLQGRVLNGSLEGYMVPVNADVPEIEVIFVAEADEHVNPLGIKGLGELGIVGAGAAIANAVFHATGKRMRDFPLTVDKLL
ncbi:MAG: acylaldehyde oxidase [Cyanobacteria bacterium RYN_339]|nr:acylaldehyde oxidase [Cyanobacteria bacterium RYN_339]